MKLTTTLRARGSTEAGTAAATMTWGGSWWLLLLLLLLLLSKYVEPFKAILMFGSHLRRRGLIPSAENP